MSCSPALLVLVLLSAVAHAQIAYVNASAEFSQLKPRYDSYQYLWYVPAFNSSWNCTNTPGVCTTNCGEEDANGPQCLPSSDDPAWYPDEVDIYRWPEQVRWGKPVDGGVPSGFGFVGTNNCTINASDVHRIFWIGEAVHFNNVIRSGTAALSWNITIKLNVQPTKPANAAALTYSFKYRLQLEETNNACEDDGCPWSSQWWEENNSTDTRILCPADVEVPRLTTSDPQEKGDRCCRYYTEEDKPCADKVWALDTLDQRATPILFNGVLYTLHITGFSNPDDPGTPKTYFISQEGGHTRASIWGRLVTDCPKNGCPPGQSYVIDPTGTKCVCSCPSGTTCPSGLHLNSTCGCSCPTNICKKGTVVQDGFNCGCDCSNVQCPGKQVVIDQEDCTCGCPTSWCGDGYVADPNSESCGCVCEACPPGQLADDKCNCYCPQGAREECETANGQFNHTTCTCSQPCVCLNTTCQQQIGCNATGGCIYEYIKDVACGNLSLCDARCGDNGTCIVSPKTCHTTPEHTNLDPECYSIGCTEGACDITYHNGRECQPRNIVKRDNPVDLQCNSFKCDEGVCTHQTHEGQTCNDGNPCTTAVPGTPGDICVLPNGETYAVCDHPADFCANQEDILCNRIVCKADNNGGAKCEYEPVADDVRCGDGECGADLCKAGVCTPAENCAVTARNNGGSNKKKGIYIGAGLGAAAVLAAAALAFWQRKRIQQALFPEHNDLGAGAQGGAGNNPAYQGNQAESMNLAYEPSA